MTEQRVPAREAQALAEIGHTDIRRQTAIVLSTIFLIMIGFVFPLDQVAQRSDSNEVDDSIGSTPLSIARRFFSSVVDDLRQRAGVGWVATNRGIQRDMSQFETDLESSSLLRQRLLPPLQWQLAKSFGLGNEQAYLGRDGWLFYRPDVDYVIGRGFLEPKVLEARSREGETWQPPPQPDPLSALIDFKRQLSRFGVELLVVPIPVKSSLYPETFSSRARGLTKAVQNESFGELLDRADRAGVKIFDPTPTLMSAKELDESKLFLRTDTHWTPAGLDVVARSLADVVSSTLDLPDHSTKAWSRRPVVVEGFGDIARMLWVPNDQDTIAPDRVESEMVTTRSGQLWRSKDSASVLLLGDSFTNVFSDSGLGWGTGAGLAEQLSFHLDQPIDRIARNAGGAFGSRRGLQQALMRDPRRLEGKRLVIYQFAARELSQGDWQLIDLGEHP